jgi:hypothetical protein
MRIVRIVISVFIVLLWVNSLAVNSYNRGFEAGKKSLQEVYINGFSDGYQEAIKK